jgi:hypothetical protein
MVCNILSHVDPNSDYNIFFVQAIDPPTAAGAFTPTRPGKPDWVAVNACFIPERYANGQTLAHELGHYLLRPWPSFMDPTGHSTGMNDLMQHRPRPGDVKIPKDQSNYMNPSGVKYEKW